MSSAIVTTTANTSPTATWTPPSASQGVRSLRPRAVSRATAFGSSVSGTSGAYPRQ
jgi:hypothetical protein